MATLNELVIALGFNVESASFQKLSQFVGAAKGISEVFEHIGKVITQGQGFKDFLSGTAAKSQDLINLSNTIGMSTESIQQWQYAAEKAGVSAQSVMGDLTSLTTRWRKSQQGVMQLAKQIQHASPFMVQAYKNMYGLSDDMITLMRRGPEAIKRYMAEIKENGGIISDEQLQRGQQFKESLFQVKTTILSTAQAIATEFMPKIKDMADGFNEWIKDSDNQKTAISGLKTALYGLAGASIISGLATLATNVTLVANAVKALTVASYGFMLSPLGMILGGLASAAGWVWNWMEDKSLDAKTKDPFGQQKREQEAGLVDKIFDESPRKIKIEALPNQQIQRMLMEQNPEISIYQQQKNIATPSQPAQVNMTMTITTSETWAALKESLRENAGIDIDNAIKAYNQGS